MTNTSKTWFGVAREKILVYDLTKEYTQIDWNFAMIFISGPEWMGAKAFLSISTVLALYDQWLLWFLTDSFLSNDIF